MKITKVLRNNRRRAFEVHTRGGTVFGFPYAKVRPTPGDGNRIEWVRVDPEMGREGFVYGLESGEHGAVHIDHVLEYNEDPSYAADRLMYRLTLTAQDAMRESQLSRRELIRRMGTSPSQFYRLLDQTNYRKSMRQLVGLLHLLNREVDLVVRPRNAPDRRGSLSE